MLMWAWSVEESWSVAEGGH